MKSNFAVFIVSLLMLSFSPPIFAQDDGEGEAKTTATFEQTSDVTIVALTAYENSWQKAITDVQSPFLFNIVNVTCAASAFASEKTGLCSKN